MTIPFYTAYRHRQAVRRRLFDVCGVQTEPSPWPVFIIILVVWAVAMVLQ